VRPARPDRQRDRRHNHHRGEAADGERLAFDHAAHLQRVAEHDLVEREVRGRDTPDRHEPTPLARRREEQAADHEHGIGAREERQHQQRRDP